MAERIPTRQDIEQKLAEFIGQGKAKMEVEIREYLGTFTNMESLEFDRIMNDLLSYDTYYQEQSA
jgi:hypothetical protein